MIRVKKRSNANMYFWLSFYGILIASVFLTRSLFFSVTKKSPIEKVQAHVINPVVTIIPTVTITPTPTPTPPPTSDNPQYEEINNEIKRVFGSYYPRAMELLSCENSSLSPDKINTTGNTPAGSMDVGVFQVNQYWNKVENIELLKDYRVNIAIAWHKFVDSGYSFNQWSCGKRMGI